MDAMGKGQKERARIHLVSPWCWAFSKGAQPHLAVSTTRGGMLGDRQGDWGSRKLITVCGVTELLGSRDRMQLRSSTHSEQHVWPVNHSCASNDALNARETLWTFPHWLLP